MAAERGGRRRRLNGRVTLLVLFGITACAPNPTHPDAVEASVNVAQKGEANPVRRQLEPLTKRFPALKTPVSGSWVSGDMGDPNVPGPSPYWLDSIVELTPDTAAGLKFKHRPTPTTAQPDVWNTLSSLLPRDGYLTSDALNAAFSSSKIEAKAFLAEQAPIIVITAIGE